MAHTNANARLMRCKSGASAPTSHRRHFDRHAQVKSPSALDLEVQLEPADVTPGRWSGRVYLADKSPSGHPYCTPHTPRFEPPRAILIGRVRVLHLDA
jgi:hypothetical protein